MGTREREPSRPCAPRGLFFLLVLHEQAPPRTPIRLGVGFPRPIQLRRLLRDCSSLGLEAVDLAGTDLGEKSYRDTKLFRDGGARSALIEGAAQARDTRLPVLGLYQDLDSWLQERPWETAGQGPLLVAADNVMPAGSFAQIGSEVEPGRSAVLAVGAERGWSGRERELLAAAGFVRLSMGVRAFRTETACSRGGCSVYGKDGPVWIRSGRVLPSLLPASGLTW